MKSSKISTLCTTFLIALGLVGCSNGDAEKVSGTPNTEVKEETAKPKEEKTATNTQKEETNGLKRTETLSTNDLVSISGDAIFADYDLFLRGKKEELLKTYTHHFEDKNEKIDGLYNQYSEILAGKKPINEYAWEIDYKQSPPEKVELEGDTFWKYSLDATLTGYNGTETVKVNDIRSYYVNEYNNGEIHIDYVLPEKLEAIK